MDEGDGGPPFFKKPKLSLTKADVFPSGPEMEKGCIAPVILFVDQFCLWQTKVGIW